EGGALRGQARAQAFEPLRLVGCGRRVRQRAQALVHRAQRFQARRTARAARQVRAQLGGVARVELVIEPGGEVVFVARAGGGVARAHGAPRSRRSGAPAPPAGFGWANARTWSASAQRPRCTSAFTERSVVSSSAATSA